MLYEQDTEVEGGMADFVDAVDYLLDRVEYYKGLKENGARPYGAYYRVNSSERPILDHMMTAFDCDEDVAKSALIDLWRETERKNSARD